MIAVVHFLRDGLTAMSMLMSERWLAWSWLCILSQSIERFEIDHAA